MSFEVGDTILGRYAIVERLGAGGMGIVYRAQDPMLERDVALKVLLPHIGQDPELLQRFRREARVLAKIRNPNIITVHDLMTLDDQRLVLVLEYVSGGSLDTLISRRGPLEWRHAAQIGVAAAGALAEAHEAGIVHRDIKPSNILLEPEGDIRVADFGIARISGESSMTMQGESIGTPAYMSPEQALGKATGPASDIYSLGAVLFTATTGQVPFVTEEGGFAAALAHINRPVPDPRHVRPEVPDSAAEVIMRAMQKEPADRFSSALEMAEALRKSANLVTGDSPIPVGALGTPAPTTAGATQLVSGDDAPQSDSAPAAVPADSAEPSIEQAAVPPAPPPVPPPPVPPPPELPPTAGSSSLRLALIAGGIAVAVLVVLGLAALLMMSSGSSDGAASPQSTAEATPPLSPPPTSPAPTSPAQSSPSEPSASATSDAPESEVPDNGGGNAEFAEDFNDPSPAGGAFDTYVNAESAFEIRDGVLIGSVETPNLFAWSFAPTPAVADAEYSLVGGIVGDPREADWGLICRYVDSENFYLFSIETNGSAVIWRLRAGEWTALAEKPDVVPPAAQHRLLVRCSGDELSLGIDGGLVASVRDSSLREGRSAVYVGSGADTPRARAAFDSYRQFPPRA